MKSTVKKLIITMSLIVAMVVVMSVSAFAADYGNFSYDNIAPEEGESFDAYNVITGYNAGDDVTDTVVMLPDIIEEVPVTTIAASAFSGKTSVTEVIIPETVTTIENSAFFGCTSLELVVIPDSVKYIGDSAFQNCTALKYVIIGDGVVSIGDVAFKGCTALEHLDLGTGVKNIGNGAFYGCDSLNKVYIPESVEAIGSLAFGYVQDGGTEKVVEGFCFKTDANKALYAYNNAASAPEEDASSATSFTAFTVNSGVKECDAQAHDGSFETVRKATETYEGLDLAQCPKCFAVAERDNTDIAPKETSISDYITLIIIVVLVVALIAYGFIYVKKSKAHREKAIAEYKEGKTLSDVALKEKQEAKLNAKYEKKRAKQEKRLEIFKK